MPRSLMLGLLTLSLAIGAVPAMAQTTTAPRSLGPRIDISHPEIELVEPILLTDWLLSIQLPPNWEIEEGYETDPETGEIIDIWLRFTSTDYPNTGLILAAEYVLTPQTFAAGLRDGFLGDDGGAQILATASTTLDGLVVPLAWVEVTMTEEAKMRQIMALYDFDPEQFPILVIASAPASTWPTAEPVLEAILNSLRPVASETDAFSAMEG